MVQEVPVSKELLVVTMEECAELTQVCSKLYRFGSKEYGDFSEKMSAQIKEEAGDVYCMLQLLVEHGYVTQEEMEDRAEVKREKLKKWSKIDVERPLNES